MCLFCRVPLYTCVFVQKYKSTKLEIRHYHISKPQTRIERSYLNNQNILQEKKEVKQVNEVGLYKTQCSI